MFIRAPTTSYSCIFWRNFSLHLNQKQIFVRWGRSVQELKRLTVLFVLLLWIDGNLTSRMKYSSILLVTSFWFVQMHSVVRYKALQKVFHLRSSLQAKSFQLLHWSRERDWNESSDVETTCYASEQFEVNFSEYYSSDYSVGCLQFSINTMSRSINEVYFISWTIQFYHRISSVAMASIVTFSIAKQMIIPQEITPRSSDQFSTSAYAFICCSLLRTFFEGIFLMGSYYVHLKRLQVNNDKIPLYDFCTTQLL